MNGEASAVEVESEEAPASERGTLPGASCTYDPLDNKLRLSAPHRLDAELYARVRAAGFAWAPRQKIFVAPMWTPERADLAVELCGEIGDEDTSLVDRAEERAERFEGYQENRARDAQAARAGVERIASGIPLGQPILVGHHSEKHARRDAAKIENGMRRAVKMWETAKYWKDRAAGALRHAKYKEDPGVRYRRVKTLEADKRKHERTVSEARHYLKHWRAEGLTKERAMKIANFDHSNTWSDLADGKISAEGAAVKAIARHEELIARANRWIAHLDNRLAYERAMLGDPAESVLPAERFALEVGGRVLSRGFRGTSWRTVVRVTKKDGRTLSVSLAGDEWPRKIGIEQIEDYKAPEGDAAAKVRAATKLPPMVNSPLVGSHATLKAEWDGVHRDYKGTRTVDATESHGAYRVRTVVAAGSLVTVFLTDAKRVDPPPAATSNATSLPPTERVLPSAHRTNSPQNVTASEDVDFAAMKASLKAGVQVVSAPQLFPTPPALAERLVAMADIRPGQTVLEPSAGTGNIVKAILAAGAGEVVAYDVHPKLVQILGALAPEVTARCGDFLRWSVGHYDRIVMNPPFADAPGVPNSGDCAHVTRAFGMLASGGVLVAVMSAGVKFREDKVTKAFRALVEEHGGTFEDLPDGSFAESGTGVRTVVVTLRR